MIRYCVIENLYKNLRLLTLLKVRKHRGRFFLFYMAAVKFCLMKKVKKK